MKGKEGWRRMVKDEQSRLRSTKYDDSDDSDDDLLWVGFIDK